MKYYPLPLPLDTLMDKKRIKTMPVKDSISQHIHLLLTSSYSENKYDESFGNVLWDFDFEVLSRTNDVKEQVKESLEKAIKQYETRLEKVEVEIFSEQENFSQGSKYIARERVDVTVNALIKRTQESFIHQEFFYISPLSY